MDVYLPDDVFYDWYTKAVVQGAGAYVTVVDQGLTDIPLYVRGGTVLPLRVESAMTTAALREKDFELLVAPGRDGTASGTLYVDDGVSLAQAATTFVRFSYAKGKLVVEGEFGYAPLVVSKITLLGSGDVGNVTEGVKHSLEGGALSFDVALSISERFEIQLVLLT